MKTNMVRYRKMKMKRRRYKKIISLTFLRFNRWIVMRTRANRNNATPETKEIPTGRNQKVRFHALLSSPVTKQLKNKSN